MSWMMDLYYRLPAPARSLAASLRGYYLGRWRYGAETERIAAEALQREGWTPQQWQAYHDARLPGLLQRAATTVPHYRDYWAERRRRGDRADWQCLENWPVLEKEDVRRDPRRFVAADRDPRRLFRVRTSGTTGKPLDLWFSREAHLQYYGLAEARGRLWYGVSRHDRWAIQGAHLVVPLHQTRPPFWVWNAAFKQLYLSPFHLKREWIPHFLDALVRYRVVYLHGYAAYLYVIAQELLKLGRRDVRLKLVLSNAEPLFDYQRRVIEEAFACPVRDTYGMSETSAAGSECEHGRMHLWPEAGIVEVLEGDQPVPPGTSGDLVCTGLLNPDMPLIRYRVGDRGTLDSGGSCPCGRTLPMIASLDGRITEMVYFPDGRAINRFEPVFVTELPLVEAQVIQDSLYRLRILYVPTPQFRPEHEALMIQRTRERMGNPEMEIVAEAAAAIPRTPAGKFRTVVCNLPADQRAALEHGAFCRS